MTMCKQDIAPILLLSVIGPILIGSSEASAEGAKTAVESLIKAEAEAIRSRAELVAAEAKMVKATGETAKRRAQTRQILEECRDKALDNDLKTAETFYQRREVREKYREPRSRKRLNPERLMILAKMRVPQRPTSSSFSSLDGKVRWPAVLRRDQFEHLREQVEKALAQRTAGNSGVGSDCYRDMSRATDQLQALLKAHIREMSQMEYIHAKNLIKSLAYEAHFPPEDTLLAVH